jgi:glucose/arabinose dehydrogenase
VSPRVADGWRAIALIALASGCAKDRPGASPVETEPKKERTETRSGEMRGVPCGPRGLPPEQHFVSEGLCARVVAHDQGQLRGLTFTPSGDLFAVTSDGTIKRYRDVDKDGIYAPDPPETITWAKLGEDDKAGHNCHLDGEDLYCGTKSGVKKWRVRPEANQGGAGEDVIVGAPEGGRHPKHPVGVWDGWLYVVSGSAQNAIDPMPADYDRHRGVVKRFPLAKLTPGRPFSWAAGEVYARGLRNLTAFARDPRGRIIGVDNGLDDLRYQGEDVHEDNPAEVVLAVEPGKAYGWPFCFYAQRVVAQGNVVTPGTPLASEFASSPIPVVKEIAKTTKSNKADSWCAANAAPIASFVQAHSSALAITFPTPGATFALPTRWQSGAFIALHGSWNRARSTGFKVVWLPVANDGTIPMPKSTAEKTDFPYEVVFGGGKHGAPKDGDWSWRVGDAGEDSVRPAGLALSPIDGALYVASDNAGGDDPTRKRSGAIYRIAILGR